MLTKSIPPYKDYANLEESAVSTQAFAIATKSSQQNKQNKKKKREDKDHGFPARLHFILQEIEKDGNDRIFSWQHHGRSFKIHNVGLFEKDILPLWFRQSKLASFTRQVNMYGFTRISSGPDKGGYYHELFLRGKPFLAKYIHHRQFKGEGPRKPDSELNRPDFSLYSPLPSSTSSLLRSSKPTTLVAGKSQSNASILMKPGTLSASQLAPVAPTFVPGGAQQPRAHVETAPPPVFTNPDLLALQAAWLAIILLKQSMNTPPAASGN